MRLVKMFIVIIVTVMLNFVRVYADNVPSDEQVRTYTKKIINQHRLNGTITVYRNGKLICQYSRGYANYATKRKNKNNTQYLIASIQKNVTAQMIGILIKEHKVSLNDSLNKYYPQLKNSNQVRIWQLLDMVSGLDEPGDVLKRKYHSSEEFIKYLADHGTINLAKLNTYAYIQYNYNLLAGIIEMESGMSYQKFFSKHIAGPLNLKQYAFMNHANQYMAQSYVQRNNRFYPVKTNLNQSYQNVGAGNLYMSGKNLYKMLHASFNGDIIGQQLAAQLFRVRSASTYTAGVRHEQNQFIPSQAYYHLHGLEIGSETGISSNTRGDSMVIVQSNNNSFSVGRTVNEVIDCSIYNYMLTAK